MARYRPLACSAAVAALAAPLLLLASDVALSRFVSTLGLTLQRVALVLFVPAIAGVATLARDRAPWQVAAGAGLAALGAAAIALTPETLVVPTRLPALLFPLGLLILSGAMIGSAVPRRTAALIAAGALLFPMGHVTGVPAVLIGGDVILLAAFSSLAPRVGRLG